MRIKSQINFGAVCALFLSYFPVFLFAQNPCQQYPCRNQGICRIDKGTAWCDCPDRYTGYICENDLCANYQCRNGGYCKIENGTARCVCKGIYTGYICETDPCQRYPCRNGGYCGMEHGQARCFCKGHRFVGRICETDLCANYQCRNGGYCEIENAVARCVCRDGWTGYICERKPPSGEDLCARYQCQNGGHCGIEHGQARCFCKGRYTGRVCETDLCANYQCQNGGYCVIEDATARCVCPGRYTGFVCETDPCARYQCQNGGHCAMEHGQARCFCQGRYTGRVCETDLCARYQCQNGGHCGIEHKQARCFCRNGYTGRVCETACNCGEHSYGCYFDSGSLICLCDEGYVRRGYRCEACNCGEHSKGCTYDSSGSKICHCNDGYVQRGGQCEVGCGVYHPCVNGGHCERGQCVCLSGTIGRFCEIVENCEDVCPNHKQTNCAYDVGRKKAYCKCYDQELGYDSEKQLCRRTCDNHACENGGMCHASGYSRFCKCLDGTSDDHCQEVDDCVPHKNFCKGEAKCYFDVDWKSAGCKCPDEKMAYDRQSEKCRRTCDNDVCQNGGTCTSLKTVGDSKFCKCFSGTSGDHCQEVDDCVPHKNFCKGEAKCYFDVDRKSAGCKCSDERMAYDKQSGKCRRTCDNDVCQNGGTCISLKTVGDSKFCKCFSGTAGDYCQEVDDCAPHKNFCKGKAKCYFDADRKTAKCECPDENMAYDRQSEKCKRTCHNTVCKNGGSCVATNPLDDSMFCNCFYGTSGDYCEEVEGCLPQNNFCKDESVCHFDVQRKETACKCLDRNMAYDDDSEKCKASCNDDNPCKNNGECTGYNEKFCKCKPGTRGDLCERVDDCEKPDVCGNNDDVTCVFDYQEFKGVCLCKDGSKKFDPDTKTCKKTCNSREDCSNGGTCTGRGGNSFCECLRGTGGDLCEIVKDCESKIICKDGALCEFDVTTLDVLCRCKDVRKRYESGTESCKTTCEMLDNILSHSTCQNGGKCGGLLDSLFCKCLTGTSGDLCEVVDECEAILCQDGATCAFDIDKGEAVCSCKDGKEYDPYNERCRESCVKRKCNNGGKCGELNFCHCLRGTSGDFCETIDACNVLQNKCKDNASCDYDVDKQDAVCRCPDSGELYDTMNERCRRTCNNGNRECSHGGTCGDLKFCKCLPGTAGDFCDTIEDCAKEEDKCKGDAYCDYDVAKKEAVCKCKYIGELYDPWSQRCKRTCDEASSKCRNGGACSGTGDLKFCKCLSGTNGDLCNIVDECDKNQNKCKDGADCVFNIENQEAECRCEEDDEQYDPLNEICKRSCTSTEDCLNGGECKDVQRAKFCDCVSGTNGDTCEGVDDCQTGIYKQCKGDDGTCKFDVATKKAKCECSSNKKLDDRLGICRACDCGIYAVACSFSNGEKTCTCSDGFVEKNGACEKTKCTEKSCSDGKCKIIDGQEVCSCFEGYELEGDDCKKLICSKTACINGSCIVRRGNAEACLCGAGFTLVEGTCKRGTCGIGTCFGGTCETIEGELLCVCAEGYHLDGIGCYATQCKELTCYGGKCLVKDSKEICRCREGYALVNNVCKKILCEGISCFGGQCLLVDGKEECICPLGYTLYDDVCRKDLKENKSEETPFLKIHEVLKKLLG